MIQRQQRKKFAWLPVALMAALVIALCGYWAQLLVGYDHMRQDVRASTTRLATQSARALSLQVNSLLIKLDYYSQQLATVWLDGDQKLFDRSIVSAMLALPRHSLVQVAVTDSTGNVIYSQLGDDMEPLVPLKPVNIADRPHFQAHALSHESFFHVGSPVLGRISNRWTLQFSRGLWRQGRFEGVLVMAVAGEYLSEVLAAAFPNVQDVALVTRTDGTYLARSRNVKGVLGSKVPKNRPFILDTVSSSGTYQARGLSDGILRQYAWWRGEDYPFVVAVGYGEAQAMATVEQAIQESVLQNIFSTVLLLVAVAVVSRLWILRSRQARQLQQVQQRLELALKGGRLAAWDWDLIHDRLEVDQVWAEMFEYASPEEVKSSVEWLTRIHPDDHRRVKSTCITEFSQGYDGFDLEYRILLSNGSHRWISDRCQVVERNEAGEAIRLAGIKQDITQRKEAQLAELELRQKLSKLVAEVPGAVIQFQRDPDGHYSFPFASPGLERIYNLKPEQVVVSAYPVFEIVVPQDRDRVIESIEHSAQTLSDWRCQYRVQHPNGEVRWVAGHTRPEKHEDDTIVWYGYIQDVTAEIEVADALKDNEAQLRLTLQAVHDGLWSFDHRAQTASCDARVLSMLGYEDANMANLDLETLLALLHPQDRERLSHEAWELFEQHAREVLWMDFRLKSQDGQWRWVQARARVVEWDEHGMPARTVGILTDISQRVAESQLRQALLNRSPAAIVLMSQTRQVIDANERFKDLFLPSGKTLKQLHISEIYIDDDHYQRMVQAYEHLRTYGSWRSDVELLTATGMRAWFDMQCVLQDPSDPESLVIWTLIDISARLEADQALRTERQRLRVLMERFPAGVLIEDSQQKVVFVNERWCDLMGLDANPRSLTGMSRTSIRGLIGETRADWHHQSAALVIEGAGRRALEVQDSNGTYLEIEYLSVQQTEDELGTVWFIWDITDRKIHENQLSRWASTDGLTALPNRRSFLQAFEDWVVQVSFGDVQHPGVLIMLDIDHFKSVNDTYGHSMGDMVLKQLAQTLREQTRDSDCVARLGGEEFAVLLTNVDLALGIDISERIRQQVAQSPLIQAGVVIPITVSLGVTLIDAPDLDVLLEQADKALYRAKQTGRDRVCVWGRDIQ